MWGVCGVGASVVEVRVDEFVRSVSWSGDSLMRKNWYWMASRKIDWQEGASQSKE